MTEYCAVSTGIPLALLICGDIPTSASPHSFPQPHGWEWATIQCGEIGQKLTRIEPFSLVLLDLNQDADVVRTTLAIRSMPRAEAAAPILRVITDLSLDNGSNSRGVDACIARTLDGDSLAQGLEQWRPFSLAPTRRIAAMFGSGPIAGMIERLARRLEAAMIRLDQGSFDKAEAHRLAGLCGTLGFGQAHAAWLDLSLGEEAACEEVRRTTRLTLAAIARGL